MTFKGSLSVTSFCLIPLLFVWNPRIFSLLGVQPNWALLWLLPWAIIYGKYQGLFVGFLIGMILDSLSSDIYSQIPGLMICGFWFGKLGRSNTQSLSKWNYGLIASVGCLICGLIYYLQIILFKFPEQNIAWMSVGIKNICSQLLVTGLIAPILCSWLFFLFKRISSRNI